MGKSLDRARDRSTTLEIAHKQKPIQIYDIAVRNGIRAEEVELYGNYRAKISLNVLERLSTRPNGKLICVTGMTPTKEGDGKTTTSVGLTQALGVLKKKVFLCLREPSLAPIFGKKGGGSGSGFSQVAPMEDINLHLNGDIHAIAAAHNLLSAVIENHIHFGNKLNIDPEQIYWRRSMDLSDRNLREIMVGLSKSSKFQKHKTGFDITAASEVMAALSLSDSIKTLKAKLGKITVALNKDGKSVTAKELGVTGAMAVLLKDAVKPNLVQTLEGQPVFMHTGPFANVSHGNNSLIATQMALKLANYVVTESGFATDLGMEKLFDLVLRGTEIKPSVVVMVVSIKALKSHGGFKEGFANVNRHIQNIRRYGVEPVVAINRFPQDTEEEIKIVRHHFDLQNVECALSEVVKLGGEGGIELAQKVLKVLAENNSSNFKPLYDLNLTPVEKIEKIATELYGAAGVTFLEDAKKDLERIHALKLDHLPVCIAKTPYSFSDDPELKGAPSGFKIKVRGVRAYTGAGFLVVLAGKMLLMPGLPDNPCLEQMDLTDEGVVKGLF